MYLRLVQASVDPARTGEFSAAYAQKVLPALAQATGCLYAALAVNARKRDRAVSLSLWNSRAEAEAYDKSGVFHELIELSRPFFSESTAWQLRLSEDLRLVYDAVKEEPVVQTYLGDDEYGTAGPAAGASCGFLRVVSMLVRPGKAEELTRLYRERVLVELRREPGCCSIQLAQSASDPLEFISLTIWESAAAAERYETSGRFGALRRVLQPTLSALYQWKVMRERDLGLTTTTSEDMSVDGYVILTSRAFGRGQAT
jgi:quinol monooxygenase YgiN